MDNEKSTKENKNTNLERREVLKALGTLPVLGAFLRVFGQNIVGMLSNNPHS